VRVFGSVARGEATPESDVDLLVQMRDGASMFDLVGLWLDLQDLLGCEVSW
jgi:predicted nucleotidyltransferase